MWITYEAPGLEAKDFDDLRPFDANINVTAGSPLYALVKEAEPSSHLEIDKFRLTPEKQQQYASLVDKIGDALRQHVGLVDKSDEWEDHRFAPVLGHSDRSGTHETLTPATRDKHHGRRR